MKLLASRTAAAVGKSVDGPFVDIKGMMGGGCLPGTVHAWHHSETVDAHFLSLDFSDPRLAGHQPAGNGRG